MTSVLKNLDAAVSAAEEYGPNQYAVFDSKLHEQVLRRQAIARYLQTALEKNEIEVRYRPIAEDSADTGRWLLCPGGCGPFDRTSDGRRKRV